MDLCVIIYISMWISVGIASEGIYRLSGNKTRVQKLILAFDQGGCLVSRVCKCVFAYNK